MNKVLIAAVLLLTTTTTASFGHYQEGKPYHPSFGEQWEHIVFCNSLRGSPEFYNPDAHCNGPHQSNGSIVSEGGSDGVDYTPTTPSAPEYPVVVTPEHPVDTVDTGIDNPTVETPVVVVTPPITPETPVVTPPTTPVIQPPVVTPPTNPVVVTPVDDKDNGHGNSGGSDPSNPGDGKPTEPHGGVKPPKGEDGNNGHGNDPGKVDPSNPGGSKGDNKSAGGKK